MTRAIAITRRKISKPSSAHKNIQLVGQDIITHIDDLDDKIGEIGVPLPFSIQELNLVTLSTLAIGRTSRDRVQDFLRLETIKIRRRDHIIGQ
jgi:hypothetical protein